MRPDLRIFKNGKEYFIDVAFSNDPIAYANHKINKYKNRVCNGIFVPMVFSKNCTIDEKTIEFLKNTLHIFKEKEFYSYLGKMIA